MSAKRLWNICLVIASFLGSGTASNILQLQKQLFGFKMCQHFCQQMSGCYVLTYTHQHLTCQIIDTYSPVWASEKGIKVLTFSKTSILNGTSNMKCLLGYRLIPSRSRLFQCAKYTRRHADQVVNDSARKWKVYLNMTSDTYDNCQKLYQTCDRGDAIDAQDYLLKLCAKSKHARGSARNALLYYVQRGGCDLTQISRLKETIVHRASRYGLLHVVKCVLSKDMTSLEKKNSYGRTPIMEAAMKGQTGVFRLLLNVGSDLSEVDNSGSSLLDLACWGCRQGIVEDLLKEDSFSTHSGCS